MSYHSVTQAVLDKRTKLEEAKQKLRVAEQIVRDLETELRVWTEAETLLSKPMKASVSTKNDSEASSTVRKTKKRAVRKWGAAKVKGTRAPKVNWRVTMDKMAFRNTDFTLQDVEATAGLSGIILKPAAIRSQMAQYVTSGFLDRVKNGVFRLTPLGHQTFKISSNSESSSETQKAETSNSSNENRMLEQTVT